MKPLNAFQLADLERAHQAMFAADVLKTEAHELQAPIGKLLVAEVAKADPKDEQARQHFKGLLRLFPAGFYHTELRTYINIKFGY